MHMYTMGAKLVSFFSILLLFFVLGNQIEAIKADDDFRLPIWVEPKETPKPKPKLKLKPKMPSGKKEETPSKKVILKWMPIKNKNKKRSSFDGIESYEVFSWLVSSNQPTIIQELKLQELKLSNEPRDGNELFPLVSPDGELVVYQFKNPRKSGMIIYNLAEVDETEIVIPKETQRDQQLFFEEESYKSASADFSWAADSRSYVFSSGEGIYIGTYGAEPVLLIKDPIAAIMPKWSNNGDLLFTSGRSGKGDIYIVKSEVVRNAIRTGKLPLSESQIEQLTGTIRWNPDEKEGEEFFGAWSSDGHRIAYQSFRGSSSKEGRDFDICEVFLKQTATDPSNRRISIESEKVLVESFMDQIIPSYSNDLTKIALYSNRWIENFSEKYYNPNLRKFAILVIESNQHIPVDRLTDQILEKCQKSGSVIPDERNGPLWSPDGKYLIYVQNSPELGYPIVYSPVDLKHANDFNPKVLVKAPDHVNNFFVSLSSKGKVIAFCSQEGSEQKLYIGITNFPTAKTEQQNK